MNINLDLFLITKKKIEKWMWKFTDITDETHPTCKLVISLNNSKRKKMTKKELKDSRYSLNNKWKCSFLTLNKIRQQIMCFKDELARITRWEIVKIIVKVHFTIFFFTLYYFFVEKTKLESDHVDHDILFRIFFNLSPTRDSQNSLPSL